MGDHSGVVRLDTHNLDIVVVDDHRDGAEMLAELLLGGGHTVRVATLGSDALQLLEQRCPDVMFLDLSLPELDGYEIARLVRGRYGDSIRIVAVTGFDTQQARQLADWAGIDAFVAKPFEPQDIEVALLRTA